MTIPTGQDPIDRLHAADPIQTDDVPDASLARVAARIQEHIMTDKQHDPTVRQPRGPLVWVGSLALFGVFALAIGIALANGLGAQTPPPVAVVPTPSEAPVGSSDPVDSGNPAAGGGVASCLVYDPANLPNFDVGLRRLCHRRRRRPGHVQGERGLEGRRRQHHADGAAGRHRDLRPAAGDEGR